MRRFLRFLPRSIRDRLIRSKLRTHGAALNDVVVKVADTVDEHEQAGRLIEHAYVQRGYTQPHASGVRVTPHGILPSTIVFVAKRADAVIGTMSLVIDSEIGLPMDKIYCEELEPLRASGRRIAEVGALCVSTTHQRTGVALLLNKLMWRCAIERFGVQSLVISVLADAACLYEAALRFVAIGAPKTYPGLSARARGVALHLDLETAEDVFIRDFAHLGTDESSPYYIYCVRQDPQLQMPSFEDLADSLEAVRMTSAKRLVELRPDCFASLDNPQRRVLRNVMPILRDHLHSVAHRVAK